MNLLNNILEAQGLKYADLNSEERETYNKYSFDLQQHSLEDIKKYIIEMKNSIALQLTDVRWFHIMTTLTLKARLKNYILLEAFLTSPEKAEEAIRKSMQKGSK